MGGYITDAYGDEYVLCVTKEQMKTLSHLASTFFPVEEEWKPSRIFKMPRGRRLDVAIALRTHEHLTVAEWLELAALCQEAATGKGTV